MAHIGQAILAPGDTVKIFCTDGLAPKTVENVEKWFNFGGNIKYIDCGPKVEDLILEKTNKTMYVAWWIAKMDHMPQNVIDDYHIGY